MAVLTFDRDSLYYDIGNLAYVVADIREGRHDPHTLHQTFDICASGNRDRVDHMLLLGFYEVRSYLRRLLVRGGVYNAREGFPLVLFLKDEITPDRVALIEETVKEYLVARVLADWLAVTLPEAADVWKEKAAGAKASLGSLSSVSLSVRPRCVPPI